jgi:flagellar basal body-associated protein FliL
MKILKLIAGVLITIFALGMYGFYRYKNATPEEKAIQNQLMLIKKIDEQCSEMIGDSALGQERRFTRELCNIQKAKAKQDLDDLIALKLVTTQYPTTISTNGQIFLPIEPFTVNIKSPNPDKFLQVTFTIQVENNSDANLVKLNMSQYRSRTLLLLSEKSETDINSESGKEKLKTEIIEQFNRPIDGKGIPKISDLHFTSFVIQ